mmetsp:Transcript_12912/g.24837  ORF Transcript_12912/g.24837 Transcript_12912/m.24837 type:complete len:238 (-) Transcript_12912:218-931(-)
MGNVKLVPKGIDNGRDGIPDQPKVSGQIKVNVLDGVDNHPQCRQCQSPNLGLTKLCPKEEIINHGDNDGTGIPKGHDRRNGHERQGFERREDLHGQEKGTDGKDLPLLRGKGFHFEHIHVLSDPQIQDGRPVLHKGEGIGKVPLLHDVLVPNGHCDRGQKQHEQPKGRFLPIMTVSRMGGLAGRRVFGRCFSMFRLGERCEFLFGVFFFGSSRRTHDDVKTCTALQLGNKLLLSTGL